MALTTSEKKERRLAGMAQMTAVQKIHRALHGRPPASELKAPTGAITAARVLHQEIEKKMVAAGLNPKPGEWGVSVGYISTDLSVLGFSPLYAPGNEANLLKLLEGHIMLGLMFGILDKEAGLDHSRVAAGTRPFVNTKQTEGWLAELVDAIRLEIEYP